MRQRVPRLGAAVFGNSGRLGCYNVIMPQFTHHIFVCCNRREPGNARGCCDPDGSEALRNAFKVELKKRNLGPLVRANEPATGIRAGESRAVARTDCGWLV